MTEKPSDKVPDPDEELSGWHFVGTIALVAFLGCAYVLWKYYKHHVVFPELGPNMWIMYAVGVVALLTWGIATRFGTKKR